MKLRGYERIVEELKEIQLSAIERCVRTLVDEKDVESVHVCSKVTEDSDPNCSAYWNPGEKWRLGDCPLADVVLKTSIIAAEEKKRVGQQKHKKKSKGR